MRVVLIILVLLGFGNISVAQDSIPRVNKSTGTASFYAQKFNGRKTSSGEKFSNDSLTAAHKKLKFGTYVLVRNLKNDSTVVVKINDRLPQKSKRSIDLTTKAAKQLNFIKSGLTKVEIIVLDSLKK
jgi:rare lipoprotein A